MALFGVEIAICWSVCLLSFINFANSLLRISRFLPEMTASYRQEKLHIWESFSKELNLNFIIMLAKLLALMLASNHTLSLSRKQNILLIIIYLRSAVYKFGVTIQNRIIACMLKINYSGSQLNFKPGFLFQFEFVTYFEQFQGKFERVQHNSAKT